MLIFIVGIAQAKAFMFDLAVPAAPKRQRGRIATYPLLATRRFDQRGLGIATQPAMLTDNRLGFHAVVSHGVPLLVMGLRLPFDEVTGCPGLPAHLLLQTRVESNLNPAPFSRGTPEPSRGTIMSHLSKMRHSRDQWKAKAIGRGQAQRDQRKVTARLRARDHQVVKTLGATEARGRQLEAQQQGLATRSKGEVVDLALNLFFVARISFRAVSRVLALLASVVGIPKAPCPQTILNWVIRLAIVRLASARTLRGFPLAAAPFPHGLSWMIDISIGLGAGKLLAVLAFDAHHHQLEAGALTLRHVRCIGVSVAASWNGDTSADFLKQLIATLGRPAAYLKDSGSDLPRAVALLEEQGVGSPCMIDAISHAAASMLKRPYQHHPAFERFVSAWGQASGKLKHTLLACLAPPTVRTKARFMNIQRLLTWAERVLQLSPPGGAKAGSRLAKRRAAVGELPSCKALSKRLQGDAGALLACQEILKTQGLSPATLGQCEGLIDNMATVTLRQEFRAYLAYELQSATALGLDQIGLPIRSDSIESLFGVAKRHGVGEMQDADRMALRLPAFCGAPTREEAEQVLEISVARQQAFTATFTSLTKQRREVLTHPERLESLGEHPSEAHVALLPSPKKRSNDDARISIERIYGKCDEPQLALPDEPLVIENRGPPGNAKTAMTF